jgi:hypothetical protein
MAKSVVGITAQGAALCYRTIVAESACAAPCGAHPPIAMYIGSFAVLRTLSKKIVADAGSLLEKGTLSWRMIETSMRQSSRGRDYEPETSAGSRLLGDN